MRRIVFALMSTVTAVVLLFGYRTSTPHPAVASTTTAAAAGGDGSTSSGTSSTAAAPTPTATATTPAEPDPTSAATTPAAPSPSASSGTRTVTGAAADTRWGPVQVKITVSGSKITAVDLVQVPSENGRDVEINSYAVPVLTQETLTAQSAQIDTVSGATVTSEGYLTSLQSALDQAGL